MKIPENVRVFVELKNCLQDLSCSMWEVEFLEGEGSVRTERTGSGTIQVLASKGSVVPVLVWPLDEEGRRFARPLGCIFPYGAELDLYGGFCASVYMGIFSDMEGDFNERQCWLDFFNWEKLLLTVKQFENPWELDMQRIKSKIENRSISKTDFVIKK